MARKYELKARALSRVNPALVKAEREFLKGKRYPEIKVRFEFADGSVVTHPLTPKPKTDREEIGSSRLEFEPKDA